MNKNHTKTLFTAGMLLSFLGVIAFSMIYMAKDNNYDNTIYQYFNISKHLYSRLVYLNIRKGTLVNGMNLCSLLFIICNYALSQCSTSKLPTPFNRRLKLALLIFWLLQALLYNTSFYQFIYHGGLGFLPDPIVLRNFYSIFHIITVTGNFLTLLAAFWYLIAAAVKKEPIKELRYIKWSLVIIDLGICSLYFYMYYSLPGSFLWVSRAVGYTAYLSMDMNDYISFMQIIPYLIVLFIVILWVNLYRYDKTLRNMKKEEYVFSSIVASSEISTRAFSHYVKNELLGILSETEYIMKAPEERLGNLSNIQSSCMEVYERLDKLQKNSNRIVLNQSLHNIISILENSLHDNKDFFLQNDIGVAFIPDVQNCNVFCDPHYLREVFQNIYNKAAEAMKDTPHDARRLTVTTTIYESQLKIQISDSGPGISPSMLVNLFEPFVSTKSTKYNWGIGLSFVKRIINSHNGKIEARNLPEGGAAFLIYLPILE